MKLNITVLAGDGIGPEVTGEAVAVLKQIAEQGGHEFTFVEKRIGGVAIKNDGTPLPQDTIDAALASDAVLLGAVGANEFNALPPNKRPEAGLLGIRAALGGFANLRPAFAFKELTVNSPLRPEIVDGCDILFVRELLGGLYFGKPRECSRIVQRDAALVAREEWCSQAGLKAKHALTHRALCHVQFQPRRGD